MTEPTPIARRIYEYICEHPGSTSIDIVRGMELANNSIVSYLATCEAQGWLLSEDEYGGLWPWEEENQNNE